MGNNRERIGQKSCWHAIQTYIINRKNFFGRQGDASPLPPKMPRYKSMREWENKVRKVVPYTPGEQPNEPDMIKLNTNENPYPPSPRVLEALHAIRPERLKLYPDPTAGSLVRALAEYHGVDESRVFVGVGSDDVLAMCFLTFFQSGKPILFPDITYSFYDVWADLFQIPYKKMLLNEDFEIVTEDYTAQTEETGGIIFPNPNAPTGIELGQNEIEEIVRKNPDKIVIVDEAYVDFGATSAVHLLDRYDNLIVVRTFSKSRALAGMRIGYALGSPDAIRYLNDAKYSFNSYTMDQTSLAAGKASVEDETYFREMLDRVISTREWTKQELRKLGFTFADSKANFIFASHSSCPAKQLFEALREAHIYVRYFNKPRIDNYLRITVGTRTEMETFIKFLEKYLSEERIHAK